MPAKKRCTLGALACVSMLLAGTAAAQTFAARPIRLIVGFPPGGAADIVARIVAPGIGEALGGQVVVDNRGGANGIIGMEALAKAAPDGYTIGLVSISAMVLNVHLYQNISYHTLKDFTPLSNVGFVPLAIAVHPSVPARSLPELIALARAKPSRLTFGTPGIGGLQHLTIELLNSAGNIKLQHIPYKGTGPAMTDVLGGQIDGMVTAVSGLITSAQAGKLRALAVTGAERSPALPDVATVREQGLPSLLVVNWYAIAGPANMPTVMANAFNAAIVKTVGVSAVASKLAAAGVDPKTDASPAVFAAFVRDEFNRWGKVVKDAGIKAE